MRTGKCNKKDTYLGTQILWIDKDTLNQILAKRKHELPINTNLFKINPDLTSYAAYDPKKLRIEIYEVKDD